MFNSRYKRSDVLKYADVYSAQLSGIKLNTQWYHKSRYTKDFGALCRFSLLKKMNMLMQTLTIQSICTAFS